MENGTVNLTLPQEMLHVSGESSVMVQFPLLLLLLCCFAAGWDGEGVECRFNELFVRKLVNLCALCKLALFIKRVRANLLTRARSNNVDLVVLNAIETEIHFSFLLFLFFFFYFFFVPILQVSLSSRRYCAALKRAFGHSFQQLCILFSL